MNNYHTDNLIRNHICKQTILSAIFQANLNQPDATHDNPTVLVPNICNLLWQVQLSFKWQADHSKFMPQCGLLHQRSVISGSKSLPTLPPKHWFLWYYH